MISHLKQSKGITLIALVITIIVLLILAGVTIVALTGDNGIIGRASKAGKDYEIAGIKEQIQADILGKTDENFNISNSILENILQEYGEVIYEDGERTIPIGVNPKKYPEEEILLVDIWNGSTVADEDDENFVNGVNIPKLTGELEAVYWDGTDWVNPSSNEQWYNYSNRQWANAVIRDENDRITSHWVWIPRYEYQIQASNEGASTAGEILVNFIPTRKTSATGASDGYRIHPAFEDGSSNGKGNNYMNGEWDKELSGIWVAKFEASRADNTLDTQGSSTTLTVRPDVKSWISITTGESYTNCLDMLPIQYGSHMMKNSEWGAVAYLSQSAYGKYGENGEEIKTNDNSSIVTGGGDYKRNVKQSSTGTIYGIYDLSGGAWERTAAYITNGDANLGYGSSFVDINIEADPEGYKTKSTKYATVYPYGDSNIAGYTEYKNAGYGYGDAVLETSTRGSGSTSWNGDYSYFPNTSVPFFIRGGVFNHGSNAGVFAFITSNGSETTGYSFRPVLAL